MLVIEIAPGGVGGVESLGVENAFDCGVTDVSPSPSRARTWKVYDVNGARPVRFTVSTLPSCVHAPVVPSR